MTPLRKFRFLISAMFMMVFLLLNACTAPTAVTLTKTESPRTNTPTSDPTATKTNPTKTTPPEEDSFTATPPPSTTSTPTPDLRRRYEIWQSWPVYPELSPEMLAAYQRGQKSGRDPHAFSVIGDCQSSPTYFLNLYDQGLYSLPQDEEHLQETIDWYAGSFSHRSITVANGLTAPGVLNPRWSDPDQCQKQEKPIDCEIRLQNPSVVLISLGTNWHPSLSHAEYLEYLYQIIEKLLEEDIVPVLSTKADNVEGDHGRNLAMAQAAYEYRLPLWNFWATVQDLPNAGLDKTRNNEYLTRKGWDIRNRSALMLLDQIHRQLNDIQE